MAKSNYSIIVGIDPGMGGGITVIQQNTQPLIFDVPLKEVGTGKKRHMVYDVVGMSDLLRPFKGKKTVICIEQVHAMPGQGVSSTFNFGRGFGLWEGVSAGLKCDTEVITPQSWKKQWASELIMPAIDKPEILDLTPSDLRKLGKDKQNEFDEAKKEYNRKKAKQKEAAKDAARLLASKLYPNLADKFELKKHDGRAESLLIAERKRLEIENAKR